MNTLVYRVTAGPRGPMSPAWLRRLFRGLMATAAFALLFGWLCGVTRLDLDQPLDYWGDALEMLSYFDQDYIANDFHTRLHAPFELDHASNSIYLYNALFQSNSNLMWLAHLVAGGSTIRTMNVAFLCTFVLAFMIAYWVCGRLGLATPFRFCSATLYALMPYHFARGDQHFFESCYYFTPLLALVIFQLWSARPLAHRWDGNGWRLDWRDRRAWLAVVLLAFFSSFHPYHQFFFAVLVACAAPLAALYRGNWRPLWIGFGLAIYALAVLVIKGAIAHHLITPELALSTNAQAISGYGEAEKYPLKIAQMLLPVQGHRWSALATLRATYDGANPLNNENGSTTLGFIGGLGLVACVLLALVPASRWRMSRAGKMGTLILIILLFASMGGISSLISIVSLVVLGPNSELTQTRGWNRMIIFIGFFAYFSAFWFLHRGLVALHQRWPALPRRALLWFAAAAVLAFALWDQVPFQLIHQQPGEYQGDRNFFARVEASVPENSRILQLPFLIHHWSGWLRPHIYYTDQLRPYLASKNLHFTYGGDLGSQQLQWLRAATALPADQAAAHLCTYGFAGVLLHRNMVENPAEIETPWAALLGAPALSSDDGIFAFFDLRNYCTQHAIKPLDMQAFKQTLEADLREGRHTVPGGALEHNIGHAQAQADGNIAWAASANEDGWLAFGPREPLAPGRYRAVFEFSSVATSLDHGALNLNISARGPLNGGSDVILGNVDLAASSQPAQASKDIAFTLPRDLTDVQYRVVKPRGVEATLRAVVVQRIGD